MLTEEYGNLAASGLVLALSYLGFWIATVIGHGNVAAVGIAAISGQVPGSAEHRRARLIRERRHRPAAGATEPTRSLG
jgi:hypothetical protein